MARGRASAGDQVDVKSSPVDVVTAVDTASEELIVGRLLGRPARRRRAGGGGRRPGRHQRRALDRRPDRRHGQLPLRPARLRGVHRRRGRRRGRAPGRSSTWPPASCSPPRPAAGRPLSTPAGRDRCGCAGSGPASLEQTLVGHRLRLPGGAAAGAGRRRRRAAAAGARHPPARQRRARPVRRRRRTGGRLLRAATSTRGTTPPVRWSPPRPGWWSPACPAARSPTRWRSRRRRRVADAVRSTCWPSCTPERRRSA